MNAMALASRSNKAAFWNRAAGPWDVILHLGLHLTGSKAFPSYPWRLHSELFNRKISFWKRVVLDILEDCVLVIKATGKTSRANRTWCDVITDPACTVPDTEIRAVPFKRHQMRSEKMLNGFIDEPGTIHTIEELIHSAPTLTALWAILSKRCYVAGLCSLGSQESAERWIPFDQKQSAQLCDTYADGMRCLNLGAGGLVTLKKDTEQFRMVNILQFGPFERGQRHDK